MIAEGFAAIGAKTTLLPGGEVFSALEKGTIEAADYTGPAVNLGPRFPAGYQIHPGWGRADWNRSTSRWDLMDFCVGMPSRNKLSNKMKQWVEDEIEVLFAHPPRRDPEGRHSCLGQVREGRTEINRLSVEDLEKFQRVAIPIWFKMGQQGQGCGAHLQAAARGHGIAEFRLCRARHVQGPEARPLTVFSKYRARFPTKIGCLTSMGVLVARAKAGSRGSRKKVKEVKFGWTKQSASCEMTASRPSS